MELKKALTIAGSDSCGGAGIQADIKTISANGVYAMSAITALTAQNTTGVTAIQEVTPKFLEQQIDAVFSDIRPDSVKIGMVSSVKLIEVIADRLKFYKATNIVVDPVMIATSGSRLIEGEAIDVLKNELLPLATVITPNIPEAEILTSKKLYTKEDFTEAAKYLCNTFGCSVLIKGGHSENDASDFLYTNSSQKWYISKRINNPNTHGTGCTLSSAIAANLAKGFTLQVSVERSKDYITNALMANLNLGHGSGPLNHNFNLSGKYAEEAYI